MHSERKKHQEQSVQRPHGDPRATLHRIEIIIEVDVLLREIALISLVSEWAEVV